MWLASSSVCLMRTVSWCVRLSGRDLASKHKSQWQQRETMFPCYYKPIESLSLEKSTWPQTRRSPATFQVMVETPRHILPFSHSLALFLSFLFSRLQSSCMTGNILKLIQIWKHSKTGRKIVGHECLVIQCYYSRLWVCGVYVCVRAHACNPTWG